MKQPIVGYHQDEESHWVAELRCGHGQHVRHDPPWQVREWVTTAEGRASRLGAELECVRCDETPASSAQPSAMHLAWPAMQYLPSYAQALQQGWSPDNLRPEAAQDELERIARDAPRFVAEQVDPEAKGPPVVLRDGSVVRRIPGYRRWMWDGEFCGVIGFRWQPGTSELPRHVLGHIGFSVVPWKRRRGYATRALQLLLPEVRAAGLPYVELTTNVTNVASQRVIEAAGGRVVERFFKPAVHGGGESLRYRIELG